MFTFNPEISFGNLLTLVGLVFGFVSVYVKMNARLASIETWMKAHEKLDTERFANISADVRELRRYQQDRPIGP